MFIKYPSLTNHYREKEIAWWLENFPDIGDCQYVITEKLHGTNIQVVIHYDGTFSLASRNTILAPDENFFGVWDIMGDYLELIQRLYYEMTRVDIVQANLYGELIGPGIQKGVDYGDKKRILFFDACVDGEWLPWTNFYSLLEGMDIVPIIGFAEDFSSALEGDYSKSTTAVGKSGDIIEGVVIKPIQHVFESERGSLFIIKKKNEAFKEKQKAPKVKASDPVVGQFNDLFRTYITENRMHNVFSHYGPIEAPKQIGQYIRYILEDAQKDFLAENDVSELDKGQLRAVFNVGSLIANMLKSEL